MVRCSARFLDKDSKYPAPSVRLQFQIDQLRSMRVHHRLDDA
jgi:hypothetical protein